MLLENWEQVLSTECSAKLNKSAVLYFLRTIKPPTKANKQLKIYNNARFFKSNFESFFLGIKSTNFVPIT